MTNSEIPSLKTFMDTGLPLLPSEVGKILCLGKNFRAHAEEFGEEVKAVVQPIDFSTAGPDLEKELIEFCAEHLSKIKCPRSIGFDPELPRAESGKLYKRRLKERYWQGHETRLL